jgi:LysR family glycine cleavage system transcriptional activator
LGRHAPVNIQENSYDIAIRGTHDRIHGCLSLPFTAEVIVPLCHYDLLEGGRLREPGDLVSHTLIHYMTEPYPWEEWLDQAALPDLKPVGQLKFQQMYFASHAAAEGLSVALVPLFACHRRDRVEPSVRSLWSARSAVPEVLCVCEPHESCDWTSSSAA